MDFLLTQTLEIFYGRSTGQEPVPFNAMGLRNGYREETLVYRPSLRRRSSATGYKDSWTPPSSKPLLATPKLPIGIQSWEKYRLKKTKRKSKQSFESHAVDAWVLAASVSGACQPSCERVWYVVPVILHRRQLHRLQAEKGGKRKPYGGTRSLGLKRGTLVRHVKYGLCTVGGFDRQKRTISLHAYKTNKRLTQGAKVERCRVLTWVAFRSWLVGTTEKTRVRKAGKEKKPPTPLSPKGRPVLSCRGNADGSPQADN